MNYLPSDHTFSICAYGDSIYLEECINSALEQKDKTNVIICTSTPSDRISSLADKYNVSLYINSEQMFNSNIASDWNYAIKMADTPLVTIAHQDDIYYHDYTNVVINRINSAVKPIIAFTDYTELRGQIKTSDLTNLRLKRFMLFALRNSVMQRSVFVRRRILSFGNPICCPSVTYVTDNLPQLIFYPGFKSNIDWQAWEKISSMDGSFVYVNDYLMAHRIHAESETSHTIKDNLRKVEDYEMFCKFWPKPIAVIMEHWYQKSEEQNVL